MGIDVDKAGKNSTLFSMTQAKTFPEFPCLYITLREKKKLLKYLPGPFRIFI